MYILFEVKWWNEVKGEVIVSRGVLYATDFYNGMCKIYKRFSNIEGITVDFIDTEHDGFIFIDNELHKKIKYEGLEALEGEEN